MKIVFVCTGNTCRSPMAEAMLRHLVDTRGGDADISSFGIGVVPPGTVTEANAVEAVNAAGVPMRAKRAARLSAGDVEDADYCITMSSWQKAAVPFPDARTLDELTGCGEIPDPYGGDADAYAGTAAVLMPAIEKLYRLLFGGKK